MIRIGDFYGLTALKLVALKASKDDIQDAVALLNTESDSHILKVLISECEHIIMFLDKNCIYEYTDVNIRRVRGKFSSAIRKMRKAFPELENLEESDIIAYLQKHREVDVNTITKGLQLSNLEAMWENLQTAEKSISPRLDVKGDIIALSELELEILKAYDKSRDDILKLKNLVVPHSFEHKTMFGRNLSFLCESDGGAIKHILLKKLKGNDDSGFNFLTTVQACLKNILYMQSLCITDRVNTSDGNNYTDSDSQVIDTKKLLGKESTMLDKEDIKIINDEVFSTEHLDFDLLLKLYKLEMFTYLNKHTLKTLNKMFKLTSGFDNKIMDMFLFSKGCKLVAEKGGIPREDYLCAFNNLNKYGLVGLDFCGEQMFYNMLNTIHLVEELNYSITKPDLIQALKECEYLLESLNRGGVELV